VEGGERQVPLIFNPEHKPLAYYTSALAYYCLISLFRKKRIDVKYKKYTFFILALFGKLVGAPALNSGNKMRTDRFSERICSPIIAILSNEEKAMGFFNQAILVITKSKLKIADKENLKKTSTTKLLENTYVELLKKHKITELQLAHARE